ASATRSRRCCGRTRRGRRRRGSDDPRDRTWVDPTDRTWVDPTDRTWNDPTDRSSVDQTDQTLRFCPFIGRERSLARNAIASAISRGVMSAGELLLTSAHIFVSTEPGLMQF